MKKKIIIIRLIQNKNHFAHDTDTSYWLNAQYVRHEYFIGFAFLLFAIVCERVITYVCKCASYTGLLRERRASNAMPKCKCECGPMCCYSRCVSPCSVWTSIVRSLRVYWVGDMNGRLNCRLKSTRHICELSIHNANIVSEKEKCTRTHNDFNWTGANM